jgi:phosphoserine aminotransferase
VDGQQVVAERKAKVVYEVLDAYPTIYKVVPDKSVRSRMNICFRVVKVCFCTRTMYLGSIVDISRVETSTRQRKLS